MQTATQPLTERYFAQQAVASPPQVDHIVICMDSSGSMSGHKIKARNILAEQFANVRRLQSDTSRSTLLSYYTFGENSLVIRKRWLETSSEPPSGGEYSPDGQTPLYDCLGQVIEDLTPSASGSDTSVLVVLISDGFENHSSKWGTVNSLQGFYGRKDLPAAVGRSQRAGNWTFVLLGPSGIEDIARRLGIPVGNVSIWDPTVSTEYGRISAQNVAASSLYKSRRDAGLQRATSSYFTDFSGLTPAAVKKTLEDVTDQYKTYRVDKEGQIGWFVAYKTGREYVKGTALYLLSKTEVVSEDRTLVLRDKATKKLYSAEPSTVRMELGLPSVLTNGKMRLKPGNHAGWDLFLLSKSDNRLLVRGSEILVVRQ